LAFLQQQRLGLRGTFCQHGLETLSDSGPFLALDGICQFIDFSDDRVRVEQGVWFMRRRSEGHAYRYLKLRGVSRHGSCSWSSCFLECPPVSRHRDRRNRQPKMRRLDELLRVRFGFVIAAIPCPAGAQHPPASMATRRSRASDRQNLATRNFVAKIKRLLGSRSAHRLTALCGKRYRHLRRASRFRPVDGTGAQAAEVRGRANTARKSVPFVPPKCSSRSKFHHARERRDAVEQDSRLCLGVRPRRIPRIPAPRMGWPRS
jgi:hypothetical protein